MATITVRELLGASEEKAEALAFADIIDLIQDATAAQLAILAAQVPQLAGLIKAVGDAVTVYEELVVLTTDAQTAYDAFLATLGVPVSALTLAKVAQAEAAGFVGDAKTTVKDTFLNTTVTIPVPE